MKSTTSARNGQVANRQQLINEVMRRAAGHWPQILAALTGYPKTLLDGKFRPCPKCKTGLFRLVDPQTGCCTCTNPACDRGFRGESQP
jgi:phage/plasmid primase-like uncharacterized protein